MSSSFDYFVDGKPYSTTKPELTLTDLLNDAGYSVDQVFLESNDGRIYEDPNEFVQVHPSEQFQTKKRERTSPTATVINYEVNGEFQSTDHHELTLQEILKNAGSDASIDVTQLDSYFLEKLADGSKCENLLDIVTVNEGDKFLAVYVGQYTSGMTAQEKIAEELSVLGYRPQIVNNGIFVGEEAVIIHFPVTTGRYRGNKYKIALSFQENGYPEYPPHFVCVSNINNPNLPVHSTFSFDNSDWSSFSVPPNDFWDNLPHQDKNMKTYVNRHLTRFWSQI